MGLDEFREYTKSCKKAEDVDYSRPVEGLQSPDDYTLVIKLKKPWPQIIYLLAHNPTSPMAREAVEYYKDDIINHPVGTGPFMLKVWNRGSYLELVKNPNWRGEILVFGDDPIVKSPEFDQLKEFCKAPPAKQLTKIYGVFP